MSSSSISSSQEPQTIFNPELQTRGHFKSRARFVRRCWRTPLQMSLYLSICTILVSKTHFSLFRFSKLHFPKTGNNASMFSSECVPHIFVFSSCTDSLHLKSKQNKQILIWSGVFTVCRRGGLREECKVGDEVFGNFSVG